MEVRVAAPVSDQDPFVRAVEARRRSGEAISYDLLRNRFMGQNDRELWTALDRGRAVPTSVPELNQYWLSYAPMVRSQWRFAAPFLPSLRAPTRWIDYGCGQGLAGLLIDELAGSNVFEHVREILLIEPSSPAIARARSVYGHIAPHCNITILQVKFDQIRNDVFAFDDGLDTVHIFSNVLDVDDFDADALIAKALQPGRNIFLAVGNDRDTEGGTVRLMQVKTMVEHWTMRTELTLRRSHYELFTCDNDTKAVMWLSEINVHGN